MYIKEKMERHDATDSEHGRKTGSFAYGNEPMGSQKAKISWLSEYILDIQELRFIYL
jgi:hypothetical protein